MNVDVYTAQNLISGGYDKAVVVWEVANKSRKLVLKVLSRGEKFFMHFCGNINLLFKPWRTVKLLMCASPCVYKSSYLHLLIVAVCSLTFKQFFRYALFHEGS